MQTSEGVKQNQDAVGHIGFFGAQREEESQGGLPGGGTF